MASKTLLVKRYGRSRLYDTANRRYLSVEQLRDWAEGGVVFRVVDAETGVDVACVLLA